MVHARFLRVPVAPPGEFIATMTSFELSAALLDAPIQGNGLQNASTLREALGQSPTIVMFVRHFG